MENDMHIYRLYKEQDHKEQISDLINRKLDDLRNSKEGWSMFFELAEQDQIAKAEEMMSDMQSCSKLDSFIQLRSDMQELFEQVLSSVVRKKLKGMCNVKRSGCY